MARLDRLTGIGVKTILILAFLGCSAAVYDAVTLIFSDPAAQPISDDSPVGQRLTNMIQNMYSRLNLERTARGATNYFVSPSGNGSSCSVGTPCTLHTATCSLDCSSFHPVAGDTIYLRAGTYQTSVIGAYTAFMIRKQNGTAGNWITYRNYNNEHVIIDCNTNYGSGNVCWGDFGGPPAGGDPVGEYITTWGLEFGNSNNTDPRTWETGHVSVIHNSTAVVKVDGLVPFVTGAGWVGDQINIGVTSSSNLGTVMHVASVQDTTHLTLTTPWLGADDANAIALFPSNECVGCNTTGLGSMTMANKGGRFINNIERNNGEGLLTSSEYGDTKLAYGNYFQYNGETGSLRPYGHNLYLGNAFGGTNFGCNGCTCADCVGGETGRSHIRGNIDLRSFHIPWQIYHASGEISFLSMERNVSGGNGYHNFFAPSGWEQYGNISNWYVGSDGSASNGCPVYPTGAPPGAGISMKTGVSDRLVQNTFFIGDTLNSFSIGGSKSTCDFLFQSNYVDPVTYGNGQLSLLKVIGNGQGAGKNGCFIGTICGTYPPVTIGDCPSGDCTNGDPANANANVFPYADGNGSGGPAPAFTRANYRGNQFLPALPTGKRFFYEINEFEAGRGWVAVSNYDMSANVTIDPAQMGCFAGEHILIYNWQDNNPWDATHAIKAQTGCAPVSVQATCTAPCVITQPSHLDVDYATPFPKPPDIGVRQVVFIMYPDWTFGANTPTPSPTFTSSPTLTPTRTPSYTPSLTPSRTPTNTNTPSASVTPSRTPSASVTPTPTNTATFTASSTPTRTPTPSGGGGGAAFPAIQCTLVSPFSATTGVSDYPYSYISSSTTQQGTAACPFTVPADGTYRVWIKSWADDSTHDSFYIDVDGDGVAAGCLIDGNTSCTHIYDSAEQIQPCSGDPEQVVLCVRSHNWAVTDNLPAWYSPMNDRSVHQCDHCIATSAIERLLTLTAGQHTITFRNREGSPGGKLYYIIVTSDTTLVPSDPQPTPTPGPYNCKVIVCCNHRCKPVFYPCNANKPNAIPCPWAE